MKDVSDNLAETGGDQHNGPLQQPGSVRQSAGQREVIFSQLRLSPIHLLLVLL